jgi:hypothetical protein
MNHHKKRLVTIIASAVLMSAAACAQAGQTFTVSTDGADFTADYGNSFGKADKGTLFDNKYYFTTTGWFTTSADLTSSYLQRDYPYHHPYLCRQQ